MSLERLSRNCDAIRATALSSLPPTPFTNAILTTPLGDLIRDTDPSERGLFMRNLKRVEFHAPPNAGAPTAIATTRRKQDPEVCAEAALTYIERFNSVRPMPRVYARVLGILEEIQATKESIQELSEALEQVQPSELKPLADKEEERVAELQARAAELRKRKAEKENRAKANATARLPTTPVKTPAANLADETFHTPAAAARTLRFTHTMLMDEEVDLGDVSVSSPVMPTRILEPSVQNTVVEEDDSVDEGEDTAILQPPQEEDDDTIISIPPPPAPATPPPAQAVPTETPRKVRVNMQVEQIVAKIWATIPDVIMPGNPYDTTGSGTAKKPPMAKETIAHLKSIASLIPAPSSPSTTITSVTSSPAAPTPLQILTAFMLLQLLETGPQFSLPFNKVKELLAAKASTSGGAGLVIGGQSTTRAVYNCVAKRLLKIDRGGGEQTVKFDL